MDSEKYWRRPHPETTELAAVTVLFLVSTGPAWSQSTGGEAVLDNFVRDVQSFSAEFEQELWTADQDLVETANGTLFLERPNRFAWHYRTPNEQHIVADGDKLWFYDVELEQVTVSPLDDLGQANPAMLLGGGADVRENFEVIESFVLEAQDWVRLKPRQAGGDFSSLLLAFRDGVPTQLEFVDGLEQTTRIVFSHVEVNPLLDAAEFVFMPPAGVEVIGETG